MLTASKLAGFLAAHAIWCVSDGETLIPILGYTTENDEPKMERILVNDDAEASLALGEEKLASNEMNATDAVLLYDGLIPIGDQKVDAIVIEMRAYFSPGAEAALAVPYTPKDAGGFRVHKPKLLAWNKCGDFDLHAALHAFYEGVRSHEHGGKIWDESLDESK